MAGKKQYCVHGEENCNRCAMNEVEAPTINLHVILDYSTSMTSRWKQTVSGLNEYFGSLRQDENPYKVSMYTFGLSNELVVRYSEASLDQIEKFSEITLYPNGRGTALWSAVANVLKPINTKEPVLVVIITDGDDNSSINDDEKLANELIDSRTKAGNYTFAYLGVAKEAWGNAFRNAVLQQSSMNLQEAQYDIGTFKSLAGCTRSYSHTMTSNSSLNGAQMSVSCFFTQPTTEDEPVDSNLAVPDFSSGASLATDLTGTVSK